MLILLLGLFKQNICGNLRVNEDIEKHRQYFIHPKPRVHVFKQKMPHMKARLGWVSFAIQISASFMKSLLVFLCTTLFYYSFFVSYTRDLFVKRN